MKLGEEAKVDLTAFTLEGSHASRYRQAIRRLEKDGGSFRIIEAADVPGVLSQLRAVSDDWLQAKASAEKGFSLGFFDESYLTRFPVSVIDRNGRIEAFANIWPGPGGNEVSIDLMRYHRDAPKGVMEDKFNPVWEPRYLAYPGGLRLPRIMADVSALVAGGYRHIFRK